MPQISPAQAIAAGVIVKLSQPPPLALEPMEFAVVAEILNGFTRALASAARIGNTGLPTTEELRGTVFLDDVQRRMLSAMLKEFVAVPAEP
jgi:hypothetical protein